MSRGSKVGFAFEPAPKELDGAWDDMTLYQRMAGGEVHRVFGSDWFPTGKDWRETICRRLAAPGRERSDFKRALTALAEAGLIEVELGRARVRFVPSSVRQVDPIRTPSARQVDPRLDSTPQNDSIPVKQIRLEEKRSEAPPRAHAQAHTHTHTHAREGHQPEHLGEVMRIRFEREFQQRMQTIPAMHGRQLAGFADDVLKTAELQKRDPLELFQAAMAKWFDAGLDDDARRAPYAFFRGAWGQLTSLAPPKPDKGAPGLRRVPLGRDKPLPEIVIPEGRPSFAEFLAQRQAAG